MVGSILPEAGSGFLWHRETVQYVNDAAAKAHHLF